MTEICRIRWRAAFPTEVDEVLAVDDDGTARLVVRTARDGDPVIGTFTTTVSGVQLTVLDGQRREVDLHRSVGDDPVITTADELARAARAHPTATATFYAAVVPGVGLALQAVGAGDGPAEFQLEPGSAIVHVERDGAEVAWHELDRLETGFVSPEPAGLGGVGRPADIAPGAYGTIALSGPPVTGPGEVALEVRGLLRDLLPERGHEPFRVRTAAVPLPD
ncbi:hypothetical protein GCM10022204_25110 [Microlunatus aurantiacus]|uniref:Uncharacterized protein n=1 Tax=Microlunatus aurantiacus TaxID=446786 RepID=A0ABP7DL12_9ACTN